MPAPAIQSIVTKSGLALVKVEDLWSKAVKIALKKFKETDDAFYPYVTGIVKKMTGIKEGKLINELEDLLNDSKQSTKKEEE